MDVPLHKYWGGHVPLCPIGIDASATIHVVCCQIPLADQIKV